MTMIIIFIVTKQNSRLDGRSVSHLKEVCASGAIPDSVAQGTGAGQVGGPAQHHGHIAHADHLQRTEIV